MRKSLVLEFGSQHPRAMVLDDERHARIMTGRALRRKGFVVTEFATVADFLKSWKPGTVDVIIADWQLSADHADGGDHVLERVRQRDWDVSFVLISGKLGEAEDRAEVLARLLESGGARFVERGNSGIAKACAEAEALMERRDLALLKVILSLRAGALSGATVQTTSGEKVVADLLEEVVSKPSSSHNAERPVANAVASRRTRAT